MFGALGINAGKISGILLVAAVAAVATVIAGTPFFKGIHISPLIIGMVMGMVGGNTLRHHVPKSWDSGIAFSGKVILRAAIVFYGFRLTFQDISGVGLSGIAVSIVMVSSTFLIGYAVGVRFLKLDREIAILTCAGSAICGAAAVLATEGVINAKAYKGAIAVTTVVLFGTMAMFLYPFMYRAGLVPMDVSEMGVYIGGSVHEVAHVVAAGDGIGDEDAANSAVIVKMIRVMLIAPFLVILGLWWRSRKDHTITAESSADAGKSGARLHIPWFAVAFIGVAGFNSFGFLPGNYIEVINTADGFALAMAMSALGLNTNLKKFKEVGFKPVILAFILFVWLIFGGFAVTKIAMGVF